LFVFLLPFTNILFFSLKNRGNIFIKYLTLWATLVQQNESSKSSLSGPAIANTGADTYREPDPDRDPVSKSKKPVVEEASPVFGILFYEDDDARERDPYLPDR